ERDPRLRDPPGRDGDAAAKGAAQTAFARGPSEDAQDGGPGTGGALRRRVARARLRERDRRQPDLEPADPRRRRDAARAEDRMRGQCVALRPAHARWSRHKTNFASTSEPDAITG